VVPVSSSSKIYQIATYYDVNYDWHLEPNLNNYSSVIFKLCRTSRFTYFFPYLHYATPQLSQHKIILPRAPKAWDTSHIRFGLSNERKFLRISWKFQHVRVCYFRDTIIHWDDNITAIVYRAQYITFVVTFRPFLLCSTTCILPSTSQWQFQSQHRAYWRYMGPADLEETTSIPVRNLGINFRCTNHGKWS